MAQKARPTEVGSYHYSDQKELFEIPVVGWFFHRCGYIPVDRNRTIGDFGALKEVEHALERGESVVMFPEGTRSKTGRGCYYY